MRIRRIDLHAVELPYAGGTYRLSGGRSHTAFDASVVRLVCDDGTEGWGESTPFGSTYIAAHPAGTRAGIAVLAPALLGQDPRRTDRVADLMDRTLAGHQDDLALLSASDAADGIGLKISKAGGIGPGRRHRDVCRAAGLTVSVQDTVGSSLAFAAILHLGATVPPRLLRGVLNTEDMVTVRTAALDVVRTADGILPGGSPGLGATPTPDVLGDPVRTWGD